MFKWILGRSKETQELPMPEFELPLSEETLRGVEGKAAESEYKNGNKCYLVFFHDYALKHYKEAIKLNPKVAKYAQAAGIQYHLLHKPEQAEQMFARAKELRGGKNEKKDVKLVEKREVKRDYGFVGVNVIVDHIDHGRLLVVDGFGWQELQGGRVRWEHGMVYQLKKNDTLDSLYRISMNTIFNGYDAARQPLAIEGITATTIATALKL